MRKLATTLLLCLLAVGAVRAQNLWSYTGAIEFPEDQRDFAFPYLLTVADNGTIYVVSSRATDTTAHNALWKAVPGASTFELVEDYTAKRDAAVYSTRGVATIGNDVLVSSHSAPQSGGVGYGTIYYYPDGDPQRRRVFNGANGFGGYGTFTYALDANDKGYVFATLSYQTSIRFYNFTDPDSAGYGAWIPIPEEQRYANTEVGGHDLCGLSALRDIAVIPGADYTSPDTPFFTSRNATSSTPPDGCTPIPGGIAVWTGGDERTPKDYQSQRVSDPAGALSLSSFISTGIAADSQGLLWVTGPDSTRLWVKAFDVQGNFAFEVAELPSAASMTTPDPAGAPFASPNDVAFNKDENRAYVSDLFAKKVFVFETPDAGVGVEGASELPEGMTLHQNYPNPFNPSTTIAYELAAPGAVRLAVYDVLGREVAVLVDGAVAAGRHTVAFDAGHLPSGIYLYRLEAFGRQQHRTLMLTK